MAEGLSDRFQKMDKEKYGIIEGVTDHDFYTNSIHIPVYYQISIKDKIDIEAKYHHLLNGGHILYVEVDGYPDKETIKSIIDYAFNNTDASYVAINFHIKQCKCCNKRVTSETTVCTCGSNHFQGIARITGYLSLLERWGEGKTSERKARVSHTTGKKVYND